MATDIDDPNVLTAVAELRAEFAYAKTPVVLLTKPEQRATAEDMAELDPYTAYVPAAMDADALWAQFDEINAATGQSPLEPDRALAMALQSAGTLRMIAADGRTVFSHAAVEPAVIAALSSPSEALQVRAASVLALTATATAQKSIAFVALDESNSKSLRIAACGSLAESARNFGLQLEDQQISDLVRVARDHDDLEIRTAASQALGAVNLMDNRASEIIRKFYQG